MVSLSAEMGSEETETSTDPAGDLPERESVAPARPTRPRDFAYAALALLPALLVMCTDAHVTLGAPLVAFRWRFAGIGGRGSRFHRHSERQGRYRIAHPGRATSNALDRRSFVAVDV